MAAVGGTFLHGFDPVALSLIVLAVAFAAIVVVVAIRRRRNTPRWLRSKAARKRLDVIARDLDRLAEYGPGLPDIDPFCGSPSSAARTRWPRVGSTRRSKNTAPRTSS